MYETVASRADLKLNKKAKKYFKKMAIEEIERE